MAKIREIQTTFQGGQIDEEASARRDIQLFGQSLQNGQNWRMTSTGAITRRPGTKHLADLGGSVRLLPFEFDNDDLYIFALEAGEINIYDESGTLVDTLTVTDITPGILWNLSWAQSGDFMFLAHKNMRTKEIQRTSATTFSVNDYAFDTDDEAVKQMPFFKFADSNITLTVTANGGNWDLTVSSAHWTAQHATDSVQVKYWDGTNWQVYEIITFTSSTVVVATDISGTPATGVATKTWLEEGVNDIRGWAQAIAFHAGRMCMGGFNSLPAHIALSKLGLFWNFDVGDATDDDAIFAPIDSDQINSVEHIVSGHNLQVFTDYAEMHISEEEGAPITPSTIAIRTNTRFGTSKVKPLVFDDATIYVQHRGTVIREFLWNNISRGYTSNPLSLLANNMIDEIKQSAIDYGGVNGPEQYAFFLNQNGTLIVYHALRSEEINGFFPWVTHGDIESITVLGDNLYACVKREINGVDHYHLEIFTEDVFMDSATEYISAFPASTFSGLTEYAGETVHVTSDDNRYYLGEYVVDASGNLDLSANGYEATQIWVGYNYSAIAETMPINFTVADGPTEQLPKRLVSGFIRVHESYDFMIENDVFSPRYILHDVSEPPIPYTGTVRAYLLGAAFDRTLTVVSDIPLKCTLLSMGMEVGL